MSNELKHYGWGIVDKDETPATSLGRYPTKESYGRLASIWDETSPSSAPHRVVELFYREQEK